MSAHAKIPKDIIRSEADGSRTKDALDRLAEERNLDPALLRQWGVESRGEKVSIPYYDTEGTELFRKIRNKPGATPRFLYDPKGCSLKPYGLWRAECRSAGVVRYITEGESDTWAMWEAGKPTLGIPGASNAKCLDLEHLIGVETLYVCKDDDEGGKTFVANIPARLSAIGYTGKAFVLEVPNGIKDICALWTHDSDGFYLTLSDMEAEARELDIPIAGTNGKPHAGLIAMDQEDIEGMDVPAPPPWPVLDPTVYHGLTGQIVRAIEPETEADPVAILVQLLAALGNAISRRPYYPVEGSRHYTNLYATIVGRSAHGRKGTSWGRVREVMALVDQHWLVNCTASGLSSGEGLITAVRDRSEKPGRGGKPGDIDEGVTDKRLLVVEGEFAQCLRVLAREGNTLSSIMRNFWDCGQAGTMTKTPMKATDALISLVGHITADELLGYLSHTEMFNGFANRFLWLLVGRSKTLPDGGANLDLESFREPLESMLAHARTVFVMKRTDSAARLWRENYERLTGDRRGLFGAVTSRADAQTLRLSMIYALADGRSVIDEEHLRAALALWGYAEQSARIIFGQEPEDPLVGKVYGLLTAEPRGMTKTDLHKALGNNLKAKAILEALATLRDRKAARSETERTGKRGAPTETWFAIKDR